MMEDHIKEKAKRIKLLAMDCDGVLTDGGMYYSENGDELKKFNTKDGVGIRLLHERGIKTAVITGEDIQLVKRRALKLNINEVYLGVKDKLGVINIIKEKYNLNYSEIAYVGDDINDLEVLKVVGLSFSVADAMKSVRDGVDYVTSSKGGEGAIREISELFL